MVAWAARSDGSRSGRVLVRRRCRHRQSARTHPGAPPGRRLHPRQRRTRLLALSACAGPRRDGDGDRPGAAARLRATHRRGPRPASPAGRHGHRQSCLGPGVAPRRFPDVGRGAVGAGPRRRAGSRRPQLGTAGDRRRGRPAGVAGRHTDTGDRRPAAAAVARRRRRVDAGRAGRAGPALSARRGTARQDVVCRLAGPPAAVRRRIALGLLVHRRRGERRGPG